LNLTLKLGEYEINTRPVELRTEIEEDDLIHFVQITSPAEVVIPKEGGRLKGVLLDIDTIRLLAEKGSWHDINEHLDDVHMACKKMFFSLLKPETIGKLEPEYEV
ncbi:MAG TPA: hypothetical protein DCL04_01650, partial [Synergistaceae bacterium]|nr:hypothetical protein [Synergistaceae bacterium]